MEETLLSSAAQSCLVPCTMIVGIQSIKENKESNVFKDGIGVKGSSFMVIITVIILSSIMVIIMIITMVIMVIILVIMDYFK